MIRNLFAAALLAALCAGLITAGLQHFRVTPLILHAETFEGEGGLTTGATSALPPCLAKSISTCRAVGSIGRPSNRDIQ